jgi:hypothetical protein
MSKRLVIFFCFCTCFSFAAKLVVEGKYQNRNIYVTNGFSSGGVGFCTKEIKVNGKITTDETNSSAFEIDLKSLALKYGDNIIIEITHGDGCVPKILNLEDLKPKPTFEILTMNVSPEGMLNWTTANETGSLPYVIEQFKWNKWIRVGEVSGIGTPDKHEYSFQVTMHSGKNKYRVRQRGFNAVSRYSPETLITSLINKPSFAMPKNSGRIDFSANTAFEIYDVYGSVVKTGFGKQVPLGDLKKGKYYLCYDNEVTEFKK